MKRLSDDMIVGLYVPRGLSPPPAAGEPIACARSRCDGTERTPGARGYRWVHRQARSTAIELCPRCHRELATIISGG
jgi:hypothetical protein